MFALLAYVKGSMFALLAYVKDDNEAGLRQDDLILTLLDLFFSIPKLVPFKKLNGAGRI